MSRLLTDEEIEKLLGIEFSTSYSGHVAEYKDVAKAQDKITLEYVIDKIEKANQHRCKWGKCEEIWILSSTWQSLKEELLNES